MAPWSINQPGDFVLYHIQEVRFISVSLFSVADNMNSDYTWIKLMVGILAAGFIRGRRHLSLGRMALAPRHAQLDI